MHHSNYWDIIRHIINPRTWLNLDIKSVPIQRVRMGTTERNLKWTKIYFQVLLPRNIQTTDSDQSCKCDPSWEFSDIITNPTFNGLQRPAFIALSLKKIGDGARKYDSLNRIRTETSIPRQFELSDSVKTTRIRTRKPSKTCTEFESCYCQRTRQPRI